MSVYIYDGPITIATRTGGAVFCNTTSEYRVHKNGASCFDIGTSGPIFKENISVCTHQSIFLLFSLAFFSKTKTAFLLCTKLAHLPALIGLFQPTHIHTLNQTHSNIGIRPTLENPLERDVIKLRLHMASHPILLSSPVRLSAFSKNVIKRIKHTRI